MTLAANVCCGTVCWSMALSSSVSKFAVVFAADVSAAGRQ